MEGVDSLNKMSIAKVQIEFSFFQFSFYAVFSILKINVLTILKAINYKTINSECLVPQDMREGRVP